MTDVHLNVAHLRCTRCRTQIEKAVKALPGVAEVQVHLVEGHVVVRSTAQGPSVDEVRRAVEEAGFDASSPARHRSHAERRGAALLTPLDERFRAVYGEPHWCPRCWSRAAGFTWPIPAA